MAEQFAKVGEIDLCYETFGDSGDTPLLLIMGLGTQMIAWREDFCAALVDEGFFVIRFDNRDCGRSTRIKGAPPTIGQIIRRDKSAAHYRLADMASDAAGLLDHLGIASAHVVGASMGGMIAQTLAIEHPERVRSLTSIMSNTGSRWTGQPSFRVYGTFLSKPPEDREGYIERATKLFELIGGSGFGDLGAEARETAGEGFDRGITAAGTGRQMAAILASGDRAKRLRSVTAPALVIHGDEDRLVGYSGGKATAKAIPHAKLVTIKGMGHFLPRGAWPQVVSAIAEHARAAEVAREGSGAPRATPAAR
jgi:pimeloyl-ACP methyl ester carboxylesterase